MPPTPQTVIAVDPGSAKCGIAVVSSPPTVIIERLVVPAERLVESVRRRVDSNPAAQTILVGDGTGSRAAIHALAEADPQIAVVAVDEKSTSERARERYCRENAARGWKRLLPAGLRTPEECYDDYVAVILAEDWLAHDSNSGNGT
jgi:RNase H-fold protein (predicted Holliday junction resolvase)